MFTPKQTFAFYSCSKNVFCAITTTYIAFLFLAIIEVFLFCMQSQKLHNGDWQIADILFLMLIIPLWGCCATLLLAACYQIVFKCLRILQKKSSKVLPALLIALFVSYLFMQPLVLIHKIIFNLELQALQESLQSLWKNIIDIKPHKNIFYSSLEQIWQLITTFQYSSYFQKLQNFIAFFVLYLVTVFLSVFIFLKMRKLYFTYLFAAVLSSFVVFKFLFPIDLFFTSSQNLKWSQDFFWAQSICFIILLITIFCLYNIGIHKQQIQSRKYIRVNIRTQYFILSVLLIVFINIFSLGLLKLYPFISNTTAILFLKHHFVYVLLAMLSVYCIRILLYKYLIFSKNTFGLPFLQRTTYLTHSPLATYKFTIIYSIALLLSCYLYYYGYTRESNARILRYGGLGSEALKSLGIWKLDADRNLYKSKTQADKEILSLEIHSTHNLSQIKDQDSSKKKQSSWLKSKILQTITARSKNVNSSNNTHPNNISRNIQENLQRNIKENSITRNDTSNFRIPFQQTQELNSNMQISVITFDDSSKRNPLNKNPKFKFSKLSSNKHKLYKYALPLISDSPLTTLQSLWQSLPSIKIYYKTKQISLLSQLSQEGVRTICVFSNEEQRKSFSHKDTKLDAGCQVIHALSNSSHTQISLKQAIKETLSYSKKYKEKGNNFIWLHYEVNSHIEDWKYNSMKASLNKLLRQGELLFIHLYETSYHHGLYLSYPLHKSYSSSQKSNSNEREFSQYSSRKEHHFVDFQKALSLAYRSNVSTEKLFLQDSLQLIAVLEGHHSITEKLAFSLGYSPPIPTLVLDQRSTKYYLLIDHLGQATRKIPKTINTNSNLFLPFLKN